MKNEDFIEMYDGHKIRDNSNNKRKELEKEREELIHILSILRQDAEPDFTREYVSNMTNDQIKKEILNEKDYQAPDQFGGFHI